MKNIYKIIVICIFIVVIPVMIYLFFGIGMISTNNPKVIEMEWVDQYKAAVKNDFTYINDVNIFYQKGKVHLEFSTTSEMKLEDCKQIVKMTKDFVVKEIATKPLMENDFDQFGLKLIFSTNKDIYLFESSYWAASQIPNDSKNISVKNNYKTWVYYINDVFQDKLEF